MKYLIWAVRVFHYLCRNTITEKYAGRGMRTLGPDIKSLEEKVCSLRSAGPGAKFLSPLIKEKRTYMRYTVDRIGPHIK
jgi:hypothetical protein